MREQLHTIKQFITMNIIEKAKKMFEEVKNSPNIIVNIVSFNPTDPKKYEPIRLAEYFTKSTGIPLDSDLHDLLNFPGQTEFSWMSRTKDESEEGFVPVGVFKIENLECSFCMQKNVVPITNTDIDQEIIDVLKKSFYYDFLENSATLINYDSKSNTFLLYYLDRLEIYELDLNPKSYIEMCLLTKGMHYWQYLFCSPDDQKNVPAYKWKYIDIILPFLKKEFPNEDYSILESKYEIWQKRRE
jgi:hypothetical protein